MNTEMNAGVHKMRIISPPGVLSRLVLLGLMNLICGEDKEF